MLEVRISGPGGRRVVDVRDASIRFGRAPTNDIVLPHDTVSPQHARLASTGHKLVLGDLHSDNGTYVNGQRLRAEAAIELGDTIQLGVYQIVLAVPGALDGPKPFVPRDAAEASLLAQIGACVAGARDVYADWLEDQSRPDEARFVRAQDRLAAGLASPGEVRPLVVGIKYRWRVLVARLPIDGCDRHACPRDWGALATTATDLERRCDECGKRVTYCETVDDARAFVATGERVAIDLRAPRQPGDLASPFGPPCDMCGAPTASRRAMRCGRCGEPSGRALNPT